MSGKRGGGRRRRSPAQGLRRFWVALLALLVLAAAAGYFGLGWKGFNARSVRVSGNTVVPSSEILRVAAVSQKRNLWVQNMGAATARIEAIPYIAHAWIHRWPPANVEIVVEERTPYALLQSSSDEALVDRSLRVLGNGADPAGALPVFVLAPGHAQTFIPGAFVVDQQAIALRDDNEALAAARIPVRRLSYDRYIELTATLSDGVLVLLGDDADLAKRIPLIEPIVTQLAHGRPFRAIDLRAAGTPVVVYK
jgi:cell division septal protein FtsQ